MKAGIGQEGGSGLRAWLAGLALCVLPAVAASETTAHRIRPGSIEAGVAASITSVEGSSRADVAFRGGSFIAAGPGLAGFEVEVAYGHVASLDHVDLEGRVSWQRALRETALYPFLALGGGLRQEKLGSFEQSRYPVGLGGGLRVLAGVRAGVRVEYRFRRILHDPVADYSEHEVLTGLSIYFRNPE